MKISSYIVTHDTGFAPNPFWGYCTLANCKPVIRRKAEVGDWIVGLSSKSEKIIYAMEVQEILTYSEYFQDERFENKIPKKGAIIHKFGDNIYRPLQNGDFKQLPSRHPSDKKDKDLDGKNVLISRHFYYFGSQAIGLPEEFVDLKAGRGHKNNDSNDLICRFKDFISRYSKGVNASPTKWPKNDTPWKQE